MSSVYDRQLKGEGPYTSIVAGTSSAGAGSTVNWSVPRLTHTMYVVASGAPSAGVVRIEVSPDNGANWLQTATTTGAITAAGVSTVTYTGTVASTVRAYISTAITGGTVTAVFYGV